MAWTSPRTWVVGEVLSASLLNTHLRDNLNETAVAKVTTAGDVVYATAANALARLGIGAAGTQLVTNAAATAPEWKAPVNATNNSGTTWNGTNSSAWVDDVLTVSITPGGAYGKIIILGAAEAQTDDTVNIRVGIGADDGPEMRLVSSGSKGMLLAMHIVNNASAGAQTVGMDVYTTELNGSAVLGYRWLIAFWLP